MSIRSLTKKTALLTVALIAFYQFKGAVHGQALPTNITARSIIDPVNLHTKFVWLGDSVNKTWEPYAYMLIPVKLPHCPQQFYMQFDLGAPSTVFYRGKMNTIKQRYPTSVNLTDSLQLTNQQFTVNGTLVGSKTIALKNYGNNAIDWKGRNKYNIIGTIGADILNKKTIAINYPEHDLQILDSLPTKLTLTDMVYTQNSILLPVTLMGKRTMLFFDTGSSAFELLLDKQTTLTLATPGAQATEQQVNSWGKMLTAHTYVTNDSLTIAGNQLPINRVTYMEGASDSQLSRMMKLGIGGMTGNKLFLNSMLIIDTKAKKFGLIPKPTVQKQ